MAQKQQDYSSGIVQVRSAFESTNIEARKEALIVTGKQIISEGKDDFYAKVIEEMLEVQDRQKGMFKATKDTRVMDASLSDFYQALTPKGKEGEGLLRDMLKSLKLSEKHHFMMVIRGMAKADQWDDVVHFIHMKKPPVTYSFLAEICIDHGKVPFAVEAIKKISDFDEKIPMLIDIGQWRDAIEESFQGKRLEYLDDIRAKGPSFVEDFIREEQHKRAK